MKLPKWKVGICSLEFFMVDVQAATEEEAVILASEKILQSPGDYLTSSDESITSVFINDSESRGFAPYIPEYYPFARDIDLGSDFL